MSDFDDMLEELGRGDRTEVLGVTTREFKAAKEALVNKYCSVCGPGYRYGMDGCYHGPPQQPMARSLPRTTILSDEELRVLDRGLDLLADLYEVAGEELGRLRPIIDRKMEIIVRLKTRIAQELNTNQRTGDDLLLNLQERL